MIDPVSVATLASAAVKAAGGSDDESNESEKLVGGLLTRVLGPSADEIGEALRRYTAFRVGNVAKIGEAARRKGASERSGVVPPRVAHRVLEEGSYCDDELMVDYLGGLLAASRTPSGRDDRAISWSNLVTDMSTVQLRLHYILYREWAARFADDELARLGNSEGRGHMRMLFDLGELVELISIGEGDAVGNFAHALMGIYRLRLIGNDYWYGYTGNRKDLDCPFDSVLEVFPSPIGGELYGWAQGLTAIDPNEFPAVVEVFEVIPPISRPSGVIVASTSKHD